MNKTSVSVVIPIYKCQDSIYELYERLTSTLKNFDNYSIVFVDDRSPDDGWQKLKKIASNDKNVVAIQLSRNFGQHRTLAAGAAHAKHEWTIFMDGDLQDPPESIPEFVDYAVKHNYDIVMGKTSHKGLPFYRRILSKLYFQVLSGIVQQKIDPEVTGYSLCSRKVVEKYCSFQEHERHHNFILRWLGYNTGYIYYSRDKRKDGDSSYSMKRMLKHAVSGLLFFNANFLKSIIYVGFSITIISSLYIAFVLYRYFSAQITPGWTSLASLIAFLGGFTLLVLGFIGVYVGQIFETLKKRPLYIVDNIIEKKNQ
ncbi:MAG: glycosyltransferase family 2 protein [Bdellovibrionota bacterium]